MNSPHSESGGFVRRCFASFLIVLAALLPLEVLAQDQTGTITGKILNQGTKEYLRNAVVTVVGTNISTIAESGGQYTLLKVPAGEVKVSYAYSGLDTQEVAITVIAGQTVTKDISLTSADYADDVIQLETFVVASEKEGNAKAIMEQKNSLEAKKVLASDSFGTISEGNVGEFLKYLPGVQIDYTEADARSVSLSGLDSKYTAVTMDGAPIASSGLAAASGTGASRGFEFEQISINSVETVEIFRTPQPENPGTALAGIVNLRSKGAFDTTGRRIGLSAGAAWNSMSSNPLKKSPGWDDEDHYRLQPNWRLQYSDVFFDRKLGVLAGYNYSYTFSEQKAETVFYSYDTDVTNNATETPRLTQFSFRDSPKPTIRYNTNLRIDYKFNPDFWISARAEYNKYHAKFFSRDLNFNFTTTANSPAQGTTAAGPVVAGTEYSLNSQTATVGTTQINQGGGGTNKYGSTANFGFAAHYKTGAFRLDLASNYSRSMTWYKDRQFGFFWSINPSALGGLGFRFDRNGPSDPAVRITQTSGADYRNLANYPNGFTATTNDRQGEDQRYLTRADMQYDTNLVGIPTVFKFGVHVTEWVNNSDRPLSGRTYTRRGADNTASSADENLSLWAEPRYRMNFDFGGNVDGMPNVDRWALYKDFIANPSYWTQLTYADTLNDTLRNARDAKEQVDAAYLQSTFKLVDGKLSLAPGVRFERTRGSAAGPADLGDRETRRRMTGSTTGTVTTTSVDYIQTRYGSSRGFARQDYDTWLKYLHTAYRFTPDLILKASYNQAISRPDMNNLIGGLTVTNDDPLDPGANRATAGNTELRPESSENYNITLEYYTKAAGNITVAAYRRNIKDLIRSLDVDVPAGGSWNGEPLPTAVSPSEPWIIRTVDNVLDAHLYTYEVSISRQLEFLPGDLRRSRAGLNYTHIDYSNYEVFLRAKNTANMTLTVPYRRFKLNWNTNWREGYRNEILTPVVLNTTGGVTVNPSTEASRGWARHVRESLTHTLDFTWEFRRNWIFYVNARNIFNQDQGEYRGRSDFRTRWVKTGAIWSSGVTVTF